jgi:hypothetical protein
VLPRIRRLMLTCQWAPPVFAARARLAANVFFPCRPRPRTGGLCRASKQPAPRSRDVHATKAFSAVARLRYYRLVGLHSCVGLSIGRSIGVVKHQNG